MKSHSKRSLTILTLAAAALALSSCSPPSGAEPGASDAGELTTINVATYATSNMAAIHIGIEQGFFEEEGLEVDIHTVMSGSEQITGLLSGTFDFACVGYVPLFTAAAQDLPLRLLTANDVGGSTPEEDWQVTVVGAQSSVQTAEDLAGATIGVNQLKGTAELMIRASLAERGISDEDLNFVEVPFTEVPAVLAAGTVDVAFSPEPFVTAVLDDGGRIVDTPYSLMGDNFPNGAWASSAQTVAGKPEVTEAFIRAITKSVDYAADNPDAIRAIIPTYTAVPKELAQRIRIPVFESKLDVEQMQRIIDVAQESGAIEGDVNLNELIVKGQ